MEKQSTQHLFQSLFIKSCLLFLFLFVVNIGFSQTINEKLIRDNARKFFKNYSKDSIFKPYSSKTGKNIKIDTIIIDEINKNIGIYLSNNFCNIPFRYDNVELFYSELKKLMGDEFKSYKFALNTLKQPIEQLIPNAYRNKTEDYDIKRLPAITDKKVIIQPPLVQNISKPLKVQNGLYNKYVALWHSHAGIMSRNWIAGNGSGHACFRRWKTNIRCPLFCLTLFRCSKMLAPMFFYLAKEMFKLR